jgi:hypothetical protein
LFNWKNRLRASACRVFIAIMVIIMVAAVGYYLWKPGIDFTDGRHDRGHNAIWLGHGWMGGDDWFADNAKKDKIGHFRSVQSISELADNLKRHHITDVFPHLCPAEPTGNLPSVDDEQIERFLDNFRGFRVIPWVGGPNGSSAVISNKRWRANFTAAVLKLMREHPRLGGIHLNIEPLPSGDPDYLLLLDEIKKTLPRDKVLSIAAYPPPTRWHPIPELHWDETYFRAVAKRVDQISVMMYDAAQSFSKPYQKLVAAWSVLVLEWSEGKPVLLGVPAYDDAGVGYHNPQVENLTNALLGVHRGLEVVGNVTNFQGIAIYSEWEISENEWHHLREHFLGPALK